MSASDLVHLTGGLVVPREPWGLVLHLERIGVTLTVDGPDIVVRGAVSAETLAALRRWKPQVIMLLRYIADDTSTTRRAGAKCHQRAHPHRAAMTWNDLANPARLAAEPQQVTRWPL